VARASREMRGFVGTAIVLLSAAALFSQSDLPPTAAVPSPQTAPAPGEQGTLSISLAGNRQFCVNMNELDFSEAARKPRQKRNSPLITTMGYKYQLSVSRRGSSGVTKLFESPTIRTVRWEKEIKPQQPPQPRLPTPQDLKSASRPLGTNKIPRWIPEHTCTTLQNEYSFPLEGGRYDVYLGFDLLSASGQWVPLQSDFITNLIVEKGKTSRVEGKVDYSDGLRTVELSAPGQADSTGSR